MLKETKIHDWSGYCVFSGKFLPDAALNNEHVIPKALGGYKSTVIRCSKSLNSLFSTSIDAVIANEPSISLARMRANTKGHSGKSVKPRIKNARAWQDGDKFGGGERRYTVEFQPSGTAKIWDQRAGKFLPSDILSNTGFIVDDWQIDHVARAKFIVKTILGVGWKYFGPSLIDAVDADSLRALLTANLEIADGTGNMPIMYSDEFLAKPETDEMRTLQKIKNALVRKDISTILIREINDSLEWSVSCVGEMVGLVLTPLKMPLFRGDVRPNGGIRLEITRDRLNPILVDPIF